MTHPVFWSKKRFFYPIGYTPPVCLTQDLAPEKNAEILLLGCGDPRSILYTVFADLALKNRPLDVTCCDWEPAVLARNILLLTMLVDGVAIDAAWSIFYHFFLDEASHAILMAQCQTLVQSSSNLKIWKDSKYGSFLRFCNHHSLVEIRRFWVLYLESQNDTEKERNFLKKSFTSGMKSVHDRYGEKMSSFRAAGPLLFNMVLDGHSKRSYKSFWTTGVTLSKSSSEIATAQYVNPTFAYSVVGKGFNVHYGTDPLMAFHLAPALASGKSGKPSSVVTTEDLMEYAKSQFSAWCSSFKKRLSSESTANIVVRFFVGESLAFCQALHVCNEQRTTQTGIYAQPWGGLQIVLDDDYSDSSTTPAPSLYNVIESSDLADHVGVVNLLVATVPLLQRTPWSIIHTSAILQLDPKSHPKSGLTDSICADVPTFSMLLGVAPSPYIWNFTSYSNKHEVLAAINASGRLYESISWRFNSSFVPNAVSAPEDTAPERFSFVCDKTILAQFFFDIYLRMFAEEQMRYLRGTDSIANIQKQTLSHYVRASFVAFLALVRGSVRVDWAQTMDHLIDIIRNDKSLMVGMNNYQDLMCHLYLRNVHSLRVLTSDYMETVRTSRDRFHGWKDVPPIVCVVLKVPRQQLKRLEDMDADELMTPILQCEVYGSNFHNIYSSIHFTFGDTLVSVVDGEPQVTVKDDPKGWSGSSPLIVTFYLPSWTLSNAPTETQVGLHIRNAPSPQLIPLVSRLGVRLAVFSTPLTDTTHVQVTRHRPNNPQEINHLRNTPGFSTLGPSNNAREITMKFDPSGEKATSLIIRKNFTNSDGASSLGSGSKISTKPIADSTILVSFGDHTHRFNYPFPVHTDRLLTRIARKSLYIELESPIWSDFSDSRELSLNPFAMAHDDKQINLLNFHYLNLDSLPDLLVPGKEKDLKWLSIHLMMMFSGEEKKGRAKLPPKDRGWLVNIKESIRCMFPKPLGRHIDSPMEWSSIFGLCDPDEHGIYTLIFVNGIKFDLASHTVVIDACAVPLVQGIMTKLLPALHSITNSGVTRINTLADEIRAWKLLLPSLSERCRTWQHTDACEYRTKGIPASLEGTEDSPLCSCGKGKNLGRFATVPEWAPFHKEATRVAIGPLFTFSLAEDTLKGLADSPAIESVLWKSHCATLPHTPSFVC